MFKLYCILGNFLLVSFSLAASEELNTNSFPDDFLFGVATAAYQIEGAWNESDKGESIWDHLVHNYPDRIADRSTGDVADDSYHKYKEDVAIMKDLGVDFYRFSISWPRILPNGYANKVSETGIQYYNNLIDTLLENDIIPMVTIYHWDLPQALQELGGWPNPYIVDYYADYVDVLFKNFGDRVKHWITFNEPSEFCTHYGNDAAPAEVQQSGIADYLCVHNMLKSHAKAYHLYDEKYRPTQNGSVGIVLAIPWFEPNSTSTNDVLAAERAHQFQGGTYAHPIFSKEGDYPEIVKKNVAERSAKEGFPRSRLPSFTQEEVEYIRGTADFLGLNHYSSYMTSYNGSESAVGTISHARDIEVTSWQPDEWEAAASSWLKVVPWGFKKVLVWLKDEYNNPPIYITENGFTDHGDLEDDRRISYYQRYLSSLLDALDEGVNVKGYAAWSLLDNFEWGDGYTNRFGLYYVDMDDPERPRTAKKSASYYKHVISTRKVTTSDEDASGDSS